MNDKAPVLVVGFNRPEFLKQVFDEVRRARPSQLFLALDYPRDGRAEDVPGWEASKEVFENVDWPCDVKRNYAERNMGCRKRIESAISWALAQVDRVIVLEDDCVPAPDFFRFCAECLEKYKDDGRVGMVCGHDEHPNVAKLRLDGASYYFDRFTSIWGWATWRRAWAMHDPALAYWPQIRESQAFRDFFVDKPSIDLWKGHFEGVYSKGVDTWDTGLFLTAIKENWLSIHSKDKLVKNIGAGFSSRCPSGNSSRKRKRSWIDAPCGTVEWPLVHPVTMQPNLDSERYARRMHLGSRARPFLRPFLRIAVKCKRVLLALLDVVKGAR